MNRFPFEISGLPDIVNFNIPVYSWLKYKTLISQEILTKGFPKANSVYVCTEHTEQVVDSYFERLDPAFSTIADCENGINVNGILDGPMCHVWFKRLN